MTAGEAPLPGGAPAVDPASGDARDAWDASDDETSEATDGDEGEPPRRGCAGWLLVVLGLLAVLAAAGFYGARLIAERLPVAALEFTARQVSLVPSVQQEPFDAGTEIRVYYASPGGGLSAEVRRLPRRVEGAERARLILRELMMPPRSALLDRPFPPQTMLRGVYVLDGVAIVDVSEAFARPEAPHPVGERVAVYAIVNSLMLNDDSLRGVRILIEGRPVRTAWGWLDLSAPLRADLSLIR